MKTAVEHTFTGTTALLSGSYDSTKTMLGTLIRQFTGSLSTDKYVSVNPPVLINMTEIAGFTFFSPHVYKWSDNIFWIFAATNAAAAVTRNIGLFEYNYSLNMITWKGYVTLSGTTIAGNKTIRALRAFVYEHTTGTVSTSGSSTTITGSGTQFQTQRIAAGARIGFGSTDPNNITTWYDISSIASDTSLTISGVTTVAASTPYVIEEIRLAVECTNATLYNGGVHLIKGLNYGTFALGGTVISEATTTDNIRASYLLRDFPNQTCTIPVASPAVVNATAHGYVAGDLVSFSTTGTLTGPTVNTTFYVIATGLTANAFQFSASLGGAAVNCTVQSGTHTLYSGLLNIGLGMAADDYVSDTQHDLYVLNADNGTTTRIHKFNMRESLTVSGGISTSAWQFKTLASATVGTAQQVGNGRIFTVNHGPATGIKSLYFVTATRIYRCTLTDITAGSSNWLSDSMIENPPGTTTTNLGTSAFLQVDYSSTIDRLLISTTLTGRNGTYVAQYDTASPQFEKIFGQINNRIKLTTTDAGSVDGIFSTSALTMWTEDGMLFAIPNITTNGLNWLSVLPVGADAYYSNATNQKIITPKLSTTNATRLYRAYVQTNQYVGTFNIGLTPEPIKLFYRTSGIDDNSGAWTETISGDLSGETPGDYIQFMMYIDVLGEFCVPRRIYSVCCVYEDNSQDLHYQPSLAKSSAASRQFAWLQTVEWGGSPALIPDLQIRLYNASTGFLVLDDTVDASASGTFQYSTDGTNWNTWDAAADTVGNYIRYTADTLPNNITVRALLTQA